MAGNEVTLVIAGDAQQLKKAAGQAEQALAEVEAAVQDTNTAMEAASAESRGLGQRLGDLGAGVEGMTGAIEDAGAAVQAMADLQDMAANRAHQLERALNDVQQAQEDYNQAVLDGKQGVLDVGQAQIDQKQALLDVAAAQTALAEAEKEHGKGSAEARQAVLDLEQAHQDLAQSGYDVEQAIADQRQAAIDAKGAQLDLVEAQKAADPSGLQKTADTINMLTPLMTGLISIVALATAAQWLWNIAMTANPIGLIIVAVAAVIAGIVLLATQVDWFGDFWKMVWDGILAGFRIWWSVFSGMWTAIIGFFVTVFKTWWNLFSGFWTGVYDLAAKVVNWFTGIPGMLKSAFSNLFTIITSPFRAAFNFISDAWNNTVGRLRWSVPGWVPGVGGNSISAPRLPKFHDGGVVPGAPGSELVAVLQAGETVTPAGGGAAGTTRVIFGSDGTPLGDWLLEQVSGAIRRAGGSDVALGGRSG